MRKGEVCGEEREGGMRQCVKRAEQSRSTT
eukprot:COSAG02_NODE_10596_length_1904_cov_1.625485_3_plen_29_part_01